MKLAIVVAIGRNNVIGQDGELPWYLPADLRRFKELTIGHAVIMGRKTYESIVKRLGKPLPERVNVVLTGQIDYSAPGCTVVDSFARALEVTSGYDRVFVIGGASVYEAALPHAQELFVTEVQAEPIGDVFFPTWNPGDWEVESEHHPSDEKNQFPYTFKHYTRR